MQPFRNTIAKIATSLATKLERGEATASGIKNESDDLFGNPVKGSGTKANGSLPVPDLTDLRKIKPAQRREAVAASETLDAKLGVVRAFNENIPRYALGDGITPTGNSTDVEHSKAATAYFLKVTSRNTFDAREEHDFIGLQKLALPNMLRTGDLGMAMVRDDAFNPRLQMFPSQAIDDPLHYRAFGRTSQQKDGFCEGILRAGNGGRPLKFRVLKNHEKEKWGEKQEFTDFDASEFMHVGRFSAIGQNRPLPWLLHGQDAAVNILDLRALTMASAKINAYFAGWIETQDGSVPQSIRETMLERAEKQGMTEEGAPPAEDGSDEKETTRAYANFMGAAGLPVFEKGEKMNFFKGDFSSMNVMELSNWLINDMAIGYGVDGSFIWAVVSQSGPMARLTLQKADWFFRDLVQIMVGRMCQKTWDGVIEDGINRGLVPVPKGGADFRDCEWQGPGSITIDKGRDGKLFRDLVNSGMETRALWHEMNGRSGTQGRKRVITEIIEDIKECHDQADSAEIPEMKDIITRLYFGNDKAMGNIMASPAVAAAGSDPGAIANAIVDEMEFRNEAA